MLKIHNKLIVKITLFLRPQQLSDVTEKSDFPADEIAMNVPEWSGNLRNFHPICNMPISFISETQTMHNRNGSRLFIAW